MQLRHAVAVTGLLACSAPASKPAATPAPQPATTQATETLAFEITEGDIRNYFFRRGPIATHLVVSSGQRPRLIWAFPAGNTGVGVWFEDAAKPVQLQVEGDLAPVERGGMRGVTAILTADAASLKTRGAVLGSIRTIRDYQFNGKALPEVGSQVVIDPRDLSHPGDLHRVDLLRTTADDKHHVRLHLEPRDGTNIGIDTQHNLELIAGPSGKIRVQATALADDDPLTPIPMSALVTKDAAPRERDLRALAFLTYKEKLLAGSWRFLTYFGRDTLMSVRLLMPVLQPDVTEAALGAVLERLAPDGDVAHEEGIGDFAALEHKKEKSPPADLDQPINDYKMVDDDFLLSAVLASYLLDTEQGRARGAQFLARKTSAGITYAAALERNLQLVMQRATPYAEKPSATTLVAIKAGIPVGQWRDSETGIGKGRYPFDVNVALVPAALDAAARLYESPLLGGNKAAAASARKLAQAWNGVEARFRIEISQADAAKDVAAYATSQKLDPREAVAAVHEPIVFDALSLDADGKPVPIMNTDDGFVLLFGTPPAQYLDQVAGRLTRPFPAGLRTPVGIVVANPAFAADPKLRELFTRGAYHGAVVWSWQQALLAAGLEHQLERHDLADATRARLKEAQTAVWQAIDATAAQSSGELWTWTVQDGHMVVAPFGQQAADADESNAVQLWSTVYLGVRPPQR
jgi:hypothetical protein